MSIKIKPNMIKHDAKTCDDTDTDEPYDKYFISEGKFEHENDKWGKKTKQKTLILNNKTRRMPGLTSWVKQNNETCTTNCIFKKKKYLVMIHTSPQA